MDTLTRMRAFIAVVENEGFSAAARKIGRSKALLSKYVRELEDELGALLLNRTTRQFSLTELGHTYYKRSVEIVREIDTLQDMVRDSREGVRGRIKVSAPRSFADAGLDQALIDFCAANPEVGLDIHLDDRFVDLVEEGFDLAIRVTTLEDSGLIARRLAPFRTLLVATPETIEKYGAPQEPEDLADRPCVIDTNARRRNTWVLHSADGSSQAVTVSGPVEVNSPLSTRAAALANLGFAMCPDFIVRDDLASGALRELLPGSTTAAAGIYVVYPHRRYLPAKVRALVDFLAEWFRGYEQRWS
ncbi:LysR family transcriptional regulator [Oricola sp.]|uniref:LysR family transcriptional regulator n=1 Tax=Oricola sp. TaxID=1979950 RepID=UPI0025F0B527|nr:LysR family transcriptional regulator [Oricola sp.]MCI5074752.1 LysR family transcriptional regulator [Oricola sp.]